MSIPYDPTNGGQNATNFAPGGYYNRQSVAPAAPAAQTAAAFAPGGYYNPTGAYGPSQGQGSVIAPSMPAPSLGQGSVVGSMPSQMPSYLGPSSHQGFDNRGQFAAALARLAQQAQTPPQIGPGSLPPQAGPYVPSPVIPPPNMGPNFGGAMPGAGGVGSYGGGNILTPPGSVSPPQEVLDQFRAAFTQANPQFAGDFSFGSTFGQMPQRPRFGMGGGSAFIGGGRRTSPFMQYAQNALAQLRQPQPTPAPGARPMSQFGRAGW